MTVEDLEVGDEVYATHDIVDDCSAMGNYVGDVLAESGARGVIEMRGYIEEEPEKNIFLVRFEDKKMSLSRTIGCLIDDLMKK